jgi:hypothetical protein
MKTKFLILALLFFGNLYSQKCHEDIIEDRKIDAENLVSKFETENFANLWTKTENQSIYGVIGKNNQRLLIKLISVKKSRVNPREYDVIGKSSVKGNVCDFKGKILIQNISKVNGAQLGVDNEYQGKVKGQYLLTAEYFFYEVQSQKNSGILAGKLETKFYVNQDNSVKYDDIGLSADGYFNNGFSGTWKSYSNSEISKCNWGDYRVPNSDCDFDIGTGEFSVSEKYQKNGWWIKPKLNWWK